MLFLSVIDRIRAFNTCIGSDTPTPAESTVLAGSHYHRRIRLHAYPRPIQPSQLRLEAQLLFLSFDSEQSFLGDFKGVERDAGFISAGSFEQKNHVV